MVRGEYMLLVMEEVWLSVEKMKRLDERLLEV